MDFLSRELIHQLEEKQNNSDAPALYNFLAMLYLAVGDKEKFYECYEISMRMKSILSLYYLYLQKLWAKKDWLI
jgi:hypothetical protein